VQEIRVEVDDVEAVRHLEHAVEHHRVPHQPLGTIRREPHAAAGDRHQAGLRARVAAREQGDVVAVLDQRLGQVRDDALGAAVAARRHALEQRRHLRDLHAGAGAGPAADGARALTGSG
jgi:hypothetical protein